jgi:hypothetical protein
MDRKTGSTKRAQRHRKFVQRRLILEKPPHYLKSSFCTIVRLKKLKRLLDAWPLSKRDYRKKSISIVTATAIVAEVFLILVATAVSVCGLRLHVERMTHLLRLSFLKSPLLIPLTVALILHKTLVESSSVKHKRLSS